MIEFDAREYAELYYRTHEAGVNKDFRQVEKLKKLTSLYLDSCGYKLPKAKFPYNPEDTSTWKYIENVAPKGRKLPMNAPLTVLNPHCIYIKQGI